MTLREQISLYFILWLQSVDEIFLIHAYYYFNEQQPLIAYLKLHALITNQLKYSENIITYYFSCHRQLLILRLNKICYL